MSSSFDRDQLQPDDTLDDRGVDDVLDEGLSPPERPSRAMNRGTTAAEDAAGETLEERIEQEEPEVDAAVEGDTDPSDGFEVGDERTGRLVEPDGGASDDPQQTPVAQDSGIDGAAASAEEAAMHTVDEDVP